MKCVHTISLIGMLHVLQTKIFSSKEFMLLIPFFYELSEVPSYMFSEHLKILFSYWQECCTNIH